MKIEIMEFGRVNQTGASLLRILQNHELPYLDLFIREGLQNSLDAHDKSKGKQVKVNISTGEFESKKFSKELEGISKKIDKRFGLSNQKYIALQDSNTFGLTGPLTAEDVKDYEYGNLISLVYSIAKPQTNEGSGGSWGYGKTAFYRMGIGIIVYYTRIETAFNKYESRLVVAMAEDEKSVDSMIPSINKGPKQGMAWWGEEYKENKTKPITDLQVITSFLKIFGIKEYSGNETGTTIIIPYVDERKLLDHNKSFTSEDGRTQPIWYRSLEDYIKISIQRWYSPRLDNQLYHGGYLEFSINGKTFKKEEMEPFYKVMQDLYNLSKEKYGVKKHLLHYENLEYQTEEIRRSKDVKYPLVGKVSFVKVTKDQLEETSPNYRNSVYEMANIKNNSPDKNKPIIAFSRRPGMIVSFETSQSLWLSGVDSTNENEYIISFFVLESENIIEYIVKNETQVINLDEYIKQGEEADHREWFDSTLGNNNLSIVDRIKKNIAIKIKDRFNFKEVKLESEQKSVLSSRYASILLPDRDFGTKATARKQLKRPDTTRSRKRSSKPTYRVLNDEIQYSFQKVVIPFEFESVIAIDSTNFQISIPSESGKISADEFESLTKKEYPSEIVKVNLNIEYKGIKTNYESNEFNKKNDDFKILSESTSHDKIYGIKLDFFEPTIVNISGIVEIHIKDLNLNQLLINDYTVKEENGNE